MDYESYIKEYFSYCPDSGIITRSDRKNSNGSYDKDGYLILKIKGRQFKAHRIAWFLYYGEFPRKNIDHINRDRSDNRIINLRDVCQAKNVENTTKKLNSNTGVVGVYVDNTNGLKKKYAVKHKNNTYRFYSIEEAIKFRESKGLQVHLQEENNERY